MEDNKVEEVKAVEPTLEDYKKAFEVLKAQNVQLRRQLYNTDMNNMFKRLDYLFKVVKYNVEFSDKFVDSCITEIEELMTLPKESEEENNKE